MAPAALRCWQVLGQHRKPPAAALQHCPMPASSSCSSIIQVDYIMTHAEPYTQSVKKSARRWSIAATDFARRSLGTKTHFR